MIDKIDLIEFDKIALSKVRQKLSNSFKRVISCLMENQKKISTGCFVLVLPKNSLQNLTENRASVFIYLIVGEIFSCSLSY